MKIGHAFIVLFIFLPCLIQAADKPQFYHPQSIEACFPILQKEMGSEEVRRFAGLPEDKAYDVDTHFIGLGLWCRNYLSLHDHQSHLVHYFAKRGIGEPGAMSEIIVVAYWRHLNNLPLNLEQLVSRRQDGGGYFLGTTTKKSFNTKRTK